MWRRPCALGHTGDQGGRGLSEAPSYSARVTAQGEASLLGVAGPNDPGKADTLPRSESRGIFAHPTKPVPAQRRYPSRNRGRGLMRDGTLQRKRPAIDLACDAPADLLRLLLIQAARRDLYAHVREEVEQSTLAKCQGGCDLLCTTMPR